MVIIPDSLNHALDELYEKDLTLVCGGTDVMVRKRSWAGLPPVIGKDVLNISGLKELQYIRKDGAGLHIGAGTSLEEILRSPLVNQPLKEAVRQMASPAIRHVGTIGGNSPPR